MTPFEEAGYTKDTKFKVLVDYCNLRKGDIVTLYRDYGYDSTAFITEDGRASYIFLPELKNHLEVYEEPKQLTPFEEAGYTKDTKFKVLVGFGKLRLGSIVTLEYDDKSSCPYFKTEDGRIYEMYLPKWAPYAQEELEVYKEPKELTLFEERYTKDTKFRVLTNYKELRVGDIVTLYEDDETAYPYFKTEDGRVGEMYLPGYGYRNELEVYEEGEHTKNNTPLNYKYVPTVINLDNIKVCKDIDQCQVSNEAVNFVSGGLGKKRTYSLT